MAQVDTSLANLVARLPCAIVAARALGLAQLNPLRISGVALAIMGIALVVGVTSVAIGSTSVYWIPAHEILEQHGS